MKVSTDLIKKLRVETKAAMMDIRKALEECDGDMDKAKKWLSENGLLKAAKKADRETGEGLITAYVHGEGKIGVLVKLNCETDFVAKNEEFRNLAKEIGMQVASMDPKDNQELMNQAYIRDPKKTIEDLVKETVAKIGENITLGEFVRMEI